jgi:hypothetical protein
MPMMYKISHAFAAATINTFDSANEFDPEEQPWEEATIMLPENAGYLTFIRRSADPILVEYDRMLKFPLPGGESKTVCIPANSGGEDKVNIYWYPKCSEGGPFVRLVDRYVECVVSLQNGSVDRLYRYDGKVYIASLSTSGSRSISTAEGEEPIVRLGDELAHVASSIFTKSPGNYLGCFDGNRSSYGFVSSMEHAEEIIEPQ